MALTVVTVRRSDSPVVHLMTSYQDREALCGRTAEQWVSPNPTAPPLNCVPCASVAALMTLGEKS